MYRTDSHNNPTAFTTDVAAEARLKPGIEYTQGDPFTSAGRIYHTARLIGDPIALTIRVIDTLTFSTPNGISRWGYITVPAFTWSELTAPEKRDVIGWMYQREGGETMRFMFPDYGRL
jgi:hypothetical protein